MLFVNLRDFSLIGRVFNCHLKGSQFESGKSRLILKRLNNYILIYTLELIRKLYKKLLNQKIFYVYI
jgi:hypothetical protein